MPLAQQHGSRSSTPRVILMALVTAALAITEMIGCQHAAMGWPSDVGVITTPSIDRRASRRAAFRVQRCRPPHRRPTMGSASRVFDQHHRCRAERATLAPYARQHVVQPSLAPCSAGARCTTVGHRCPAPGCRRTTMAGWVGATFRFGPRFGRSPDRAEKAGDLLRGQLAVRKAHGAVILPVDEADAPCQAHCRLGASRGSGWG